MIYLRAEGAHGISLQTQLFLKGVEPYRKQAYNLGIRVIPNKTTIGVPEP